MSQYDHFIGKMVEVKPKAGQTYEELATEIMSSYNVSFSSLYSTNMEALVNELYDIYAEGNGKLYNIIEREEITNDDIFEASVNPDNTISFSVRYYNGGCGFSEAIGYALENSKHEINTQMRKNKINNVISDKE
jgi:hypothetical protein